MDIFGEIRKALSVEERVVVATIIAATGSTPAPLLSRMLITRQGLSSVGTIGGGCMEGDVLLSAPRVFESGVAELLTFTLDEDDQGMICGGSIEVLVEPVSRTAATAYETLIACRDSGTRCALVTVLGPDMRVTEKWAAAGSAVAGRLPEGIVRRAHAEERSIRERTDAGLFVVEPIEPAAPLVIFGGGHIARAISRVAATAGFRITIVDDRAKFAQHERFPEAAETIVADFSQIGEIVGGKREPYVLIVTRGHRHDEAVLSQVVRTPARYVGMIGSRRKVLETYRSLIAAGIGPEELAHVHAPMGIAIGAVSPEEIAVSIVAEMIAVRRGAAGSRFAHMSEATRAAMQETAFPAVRS